MRFFSVLLLSILLASCSTSDQSSESSVSGGDALTYYAGTYLYLESQHYSAGDVFFDAGSCTFRKFMSGGLDVLPVGIYFVRLSGLSLQGGGFSVNAYQTDPLNNRRVVNLKAFKIECTGDAEPSENEIQTAIFESDGPFEERGSGITYQPLHDPS